MTEARTDSILPLRAVTPVPDIAKLLRRAQAAGCRSTPAMMLDMVRLARGPGRLRPYDYFRHQLYRPSFSHADRAAFVSPMGSNRLNKRLSPPSREQLAALIVDKVLTGIVLQAAGVPVPETRAVYSEDANYGALSLLRTAADVLAFLRNPQNLPVFGKPVNSSRSVGAASFIEVSPDGAEILLGDGRQVPLAAAVDEIVANFSRGYLFQELLRQAPDLVPIAGETIATVRMVTLWEPGGPVPLYAVIKLPAKGAMVDALMGGDNVLVLIDAATGTGVRGAIHDGGGRTFITHSHLNPEVAIAGFRFPLWDQVLAVSTAAHRLFPGHGLLGFDIALTTRGAVVTEINSNPHHHEIYQPCAERGMLNPEFTARYAAADADLARRMKLQARRDAAFSAR